MARKTMTSRERMLTALNMDVPDRLPVTIHQWQDYHLKTFMDGMSDIEAFKAVGLDAAITIWDANVGKTSSQWQVEERKTELGLNQWITDYKITTPEGVLTQKDESNEYTTWTVEHIIKNPEDMLLIKKYLPVPKLVHQIVKHKKDELGDSGILRGLVFGEQAGPWQHATCLYGVEPLILATYDDPVWVHELLESLTEKKLRFI